MKKTTLKFLSFFLVAAILIYTLSVTAIALEDTTEDTIEKVYCEATLEDDFTDNDILLVMTPENNFREYTVNDFSNIGCIEIEDLSIDPEEGKLCRILHLTLDTHSKQNVLDSIKILEERDDIYSAEPNCSIPVNITPSEYIGVLDDQWYIDTINLPEAWDIETGSASIQVGIIDTGIDASHPDLVDRVNTTLSKSFLVYYPSATSGLVYDHGTHVAGIIGAETDNGGVAGVCWDVELISLRVDRASQPGDIPGRPYLDGVALVSAVQYASEIGIDILNFSGGYYTWSTAMISMAAQIENFDGLFVCSAGNDDKNTDIELFYPSSNRFGNLISVGASTNDDRKANFSNYGVSTVDIFAPGVGIHSTVFNNVHEYLDGTSMSAPIVAGVAALLLSIHPELSPEELKAIIMSSVDVIYDDNGNNVFGDLCVSGGRINAYKALTSNYLHDYSYFYTNDATITTHWRYCAECGYQIYEEHFMTYSAIDSNSHRHICLDCGYNTIENHTISYSYINSSVHNYKCTVCNYMVEQNHTWKYSSINSRQHSVSCQHCSYEYSEAHTFNLITGKCKICNYNMNGMGTLAKRPWLI